MALLLDSFHSTSSVSVLRHGCDVDVIIALRFVHFGCMILALIDERFLAWEEDSYHDMRGWSG